MKNVLFHKKSLVALTLAAATLVLPLTASAQDFSNRRNNNNNAGAQIAGGLIGGSLGAILGEEIAGRGNRTEGAIIGAIIGGVAGVAVGEGIADDNKSNSRRTRGVNNRNSNNRGFNNRIVNNSRSNNRGFGNSGFTTRVVNQRSFNNFGSNHGYVYGKSTAAGTYHQIDKIDYRVKELKHEQNAIYAELKYKGRDPYLKDRLYAIDCEIDELKDRRHFLENKARRLRRSNFHS